MADHPTTSHIRQLHMQVVQRPQAFHNPLKLREVAGLISTTSIRMPLDRSTGHGPPLIQQNEAQDHHRNTPSTHEHRKSPQSITVSFIIEGPTPCP